MLPNVRFTYRGHFHSRSYSKMGEKKLSRIRRFLRNLSIIHRATRGHCFKNGGFEFIVTRLKVHKFFPSHVLILSKDFLYLDRMCRHRPCEIFTSYRLVFIDDSEDLQSITVQGNCSWTTKTVKKDTAYFFESSVFFTSKNLDIPEDV